VRINREALIAIRTAGGDSPVSLAERAGLTPEGIRLIESGVTVNPRAGTLRKLATALRVPIGAITHPDPDGQPEEDETAEAEAAP
jgi:transcriptional regulator with XRE-family HTH domain